MNNTRNTISGGSLLAGFIIAAIGTGFLLDNLGILEFGSFIGTYWPLLIILVGIFQLLTRSNTFIGALITIAIGAILQLSRLNSLPDNFWTILWPVIIIIVGLQIAFSRIFSPALQGTGDAIIKSMVLFGGTAVKSHSKDFKGGDITAVFGGIEVDLTQADILVKEAHLKVTTAFGGVEIKVPSDWKVRLEGLPIFGGLENKTNGTSSEKILVITASATFGGVEVKN